MWATLRYPDPSPTGFGPWDNSNLLDPSLAGAVRARQTDSPLIRARLFPRDWT